MSTMTKEEIIEHGMKTLTGNEPRPAIETPSTFTSRDAILHSALRPYDKAQALERWDREHPREPTEAEKILAMRLPPVETGKRIAALPPDKPAPPRLTPSEREACAEAKTKLEALKLSYTDFVSKQVKYVEAKERTAKELRRLETTADPDVPQDITSLGHMEIRLRVINNRLAGLPDLIRAVENKADAILISLDTFLAKKFGSSKTPGAMRFALWANQGTGPLPSRIDQCVTTVKAILEGKYQYESASPAPVNRLAVSVL